MLSVEQASARVERLAAAERMWSEIRETTAQERAAIQVLAASDRAARREMVSLEAELATADRMLLRIRRDIAEARRDLWRAEAAARYASAALLLLMAEQPARSTRRSRSQARRLAAWLTVQAAEVGGWLTADGPTGAAGHPGMLVTMEHAATVAS
jgi:hypothetical protein